MCNLKDLKNQFNEIKSEAITIAEKWGINIHRFRKKETADNQKMFLTNFVLTNI